VLTTWIVRAEGAVYDPAAAHAHPRGRERRCLVRKGAQIEHHRTDGGRCSMSR